MKREEGLESNEAAEGLWQHTYYFRMGIWIGKLKMKKKKTKKYGRDGMRQAGTGWGCQMSDLHVMSV